MSSLLFHEILDNGKVRCTMPRIEENFGRQYLCHVPAIVSIPPGSNRCPACGLNVLKKEVV